ncbi:hypothetical protein QFC22_000856 [Naganishia vaughanmartiniae]|uniref:Uncharacterized protein n=1 Tax=Naganishia vaughanmartiniae TaxID=1424756 RepID=A0ACC2XJN0_9TREE|nr:hypothetical protein QFC22_000856 [Naganishia vaughanmartiniae]
MDAILQVVPIHVLSHPSVHQPVRRILRHGDASFFPSPGTTPAEPLDASKTDDRGHNRTLQSEKKQHAEVREERLVYIWSSLLTRVEDFPELLPVLFPVRAEGSARYLAAIGIDLLTGHLHDDTETGVAARTAMSSLLRIAFDAHDLGSVATACHFEKSARLAIAKHFCNDSTRFVEVLIAGLGAIYSVLPNRIRLDVGVEMAAKPPARERSDIPASSLSEDPLNNDVKCVFDRDVQTQLNLLLDLIAFTNQTFRMTATTKTSTDEIDVLRLRLQASIESSLKASFIDNVLYPALLESSMEDGSASAVAAYLACIFEDESSITDTSVGSIIVKHLLGSVPSTAQAGKLQYNLRDFMVDMILHGSSDNTIAASTLLDAITHKYCHQASAAILAKPRLSSTRFARDLQSFRVDKTPPTLTSQSQSRITNISPRHTALTHSQVSSASQRPSTSLRAIESYQSLLRRLLLSNATDNTTDGEIQETYESDAFVTMSCHPCFIRCLALLDSSPHHAADEAHPQLVMDRDGLLLKAVICRLRNFFSSEPCANLELTQAICNTANCPMIGLTNWMTLDATAAPPNMTTVRDEIDSLDDPFLDLPKPRQTPKPAVLILLGELVNDVKRFRATVPDFNTRMAERRQGLLGLNRGSNAKADTALQPAPAHEGDPKENSVFNTPTKPTRPGMVSVLTSFLTPRKQTGVASSLLTESTVATSADDQKATPTEDHQRQGNSVLLDSPRYRAPTVSASPYSMSKRNKRVIHASHASDSSSIASSEVASCVPKTGLAIPRVTLESVLDNVVVLEAFIQHLIALLVARRTLGVDDVD